MVASNYRSQCPSGCFTPITIDLTETALRVGFQAVTNNSTNLTVSVSAFSGGVLVSTGSILFDTGLTSTFVGVEDTDLGIDRLVLTPTGGPGGASNGFLIDNVRFEGASARPWRFADVERDVRLELRGIVGFELQVERVELKLKLNQHHPQPKREGAIRGLRDTADPAAVEIAAMMAGTPSVASRG